MKRLGLAVAAILMTTTGALAAAPEADDEAKREKKICRSEKMTGSLTRMRRICLTRAEWSRLAEVTRRGVETVERDANQTHIARETSPLPGGGGW